MFTMVLSKLDLKLCLSGKLKLARSSATFVIGNAIIQIKLRPLTNAAKKRQHRNHGGSSDHLPQLCWQGGPVYREGDRNFAVLLDDEVAAAMNEDGWNVKWLKPREDAEE